MVQPLRVSPGLQLQRSPFGKVTASSWQGFFAVLRVAIERHKHATRDILSSSFSLGLLGVLLTFLFADSLGSVSLPREVLLESPFEEPVGFLPHCLQFLKADGRLFGAAEGVGVRHQRRLLRLQKFHNMVVAFERGPDRLLGS